MMLSICDVAIDMTFVEDWSMIVIVRVVSRQGTISTKGSFPWASYTCRQIVAYMIVSKIVVHVDDSEDIEHWATMIVIGS